MLNTPPTFSARFDALHLGSMALTLAVEIEPLPPNLVADAPGSPLDHAALPAKAKSFIGFPGANAECAGRCSICSIRNRS